MYPNLEGPIQSRISTNQLSYRKNISPSQQILSALEQLYKLKVSSCKSHLNTHECYLTLIVNKHLGVPLKIVFFRNFPKERPVIFVTKWLYHPIININNCEIQFQSFFPWKANSNVIDVLNRIVNEFNQKPPTEQTEIQMNIKKLDDYQKALQNLRGKPLGTQPPPIPELNLQKTLKIFQYQENLSAKCQEQNALYMITAQQYSENVSRVKCIGERFSKGKILREMEKDIETELNKVASGKIQNQLATYYQNRKNYHRIKILKDRYLEA